MKLLRSTIILCLAAIFMYCESEVQLDDTPEFVLADDMTVQKLAKMGFDTENYPVWKGGDYFTVEEDINIPADYLEIQSQNENLPELEQRRWVNIVSCNEIRYITVYNNLPSGRFSF
ncbi:MAG: hypothetical protein AAFN93_11160 [Bacteroidota bacterium]